MSALCISYWLGVTVNINDAIPRVRTPTCVSQTIVWINTSLDHQICFLFNSRILGNREDWLIFLIRRNLFVTGSALRLNGYVGHTIYIYHDIRTQSMNELLGCEALKEILHYITLHASRCLSAFTTSSPLKDVSRPLLRLISRTC